MDAGQPSTRLRRRKPPTRARTHLSYSPLCSSLVWIEFLSSCVALLIVAVRVKRTTYNNAANPLPARSGWVFPYVYGSSFIWYLYLFIDMKRLQMCRARKGLEWDFMALTTLLQYMGNTYSWYYY